MTGNSSLHIEALILPGLDARAAEQVAQELHVRLGALEAADLARGLVWLQPDHAIDVKLDCGPGGSVNADAMATAIRAHFLPSERAS